MSSVWERPIQQSDSGEAEDGRETQEEGLASQSRRFEELEGKLCKREVLSRESESRRVKSLLILGERSEELIGDGSEPW
jgi:hypothetical protein